MKNITLFLLTFLFLLTIPAIVFAIELPVLSLIISENATGEICLKGSVGCNSSSDYKIEKYDDDTTYVCSGDSFSCSSFNDLYRIEKYDDDTTYVCSGDSAFCSRFSDIYRVEKYDDDTTYVCSGDSAFCSVVGYLYKFEKETVSESSSSLSLQQELARLQSELNNLQNNTDSSLTSCPVNSLSMGNGMCQCNVGYVYKNDACISHTENCKTTYGENVYGTTNNNGGSSCYCSEGHEWNSTITQCFEKEIASQTIVQPPFEGKVLGESTSAFIEKEKEFVVEVDNVLTERLKGRILLQIEEHGEAWYVNPKDSKKYYMADGNEAYRIMRYLGVGITNKDLERVKVDKEFAKIHSGKIFLQVEANGEAFYIDVDGNNHYLKDGAYAYEAMRNLGLGITNNDLRKIDISEI